MVTTTPARPASSLAFTWRFAELFWPNEPSACGLDAQATRLLRSTLTLALEQSLERRREWGAPLPPRCALPLICQQRFQPAALPGQPPETLLALLGVEVQMIWALVCRPLGSSSSAQWAGALAQQCQRIGQLYQALKRQCGSERAYDALVRALSTLPTCSAAVPGGARWGRTTGLYQAF